MFLEKNRKRIEKQFEDRKREYPYLMETVMPELPRLEENVVLALKYLYATMPASDMANYPFWTYLDYASHGVYLWEKLERVKSLSEEVYLNYVLYHRVNEEEILPCRREFYQAMEGKVREGIDRDMALEINYWCAGEATYQSTDERTAAALTVYRIGHGRCGEESTFSVNALRSMGIPARQVYAPFWSHCDDNHAWTEVFCGGKWYFMGACEPEPILNKGWFNNGSSRAMMIHSRLFDHADLSGEEPVGLEGAVTVLNQLERYALVEKIKVQVRDSKGTPVAGAKVLFQVLNYGEFSTVAETISDESGTVLLTTGRGSLLIHGVKDGMMGEVILDVRNESECTLVLKSGEEESSWQDFEMIAPKDMPVNADLPTSQEKALGKEKLNQAVAQRLEKVSRLEFTERREFLEKNENRGLGEKLLNVLSAKDRLDMKKEVLEEHFTHGLKWMDKVPEDILVAYVMNPRVDLEVLTCYRNYIDNYFTPEQKQGMREQPEQIWRIITNNITAKPEMERRSLITTPVAVMKLGVASLLSQKILFVAIARTLGIPARLNPADKSMEYWKDGRFVSLIPGTEKSSKVIFVGETQDMVWTYLQNWSVSRLEDGVYRTLQYGKMTWEEGKTWQQMEPGTYRILTANRLPNGTVFGKQKIFTVAPGETREIGLSLKEARLSEMLENNQINSFELKTGTGESVGADEITRDGKSILMFLEESREPTEHILNELMERQDEFRSLKGKIVFVIRSKEALEDPTLSKCLKALPQVEVYYDSFEEIIEVLGRRMYVDPEKLPMIVVTEKGLNGIYATSGYNVGTADMLLRIMKL